MKSVLILAVCALLLAALSPATAGEKLRASAIHIDNAIKLAGHEPASCINYVTELCSFESDDGQSQLGLIDCANREVNVWEDRLNTTYAALMAKGPAGADSR
ncbi:hypothetical protein EN852_031815 [Mesorhizobium sp. M2E.F.Ca.ET.209.01.1.1]|uniref:lysozyme inhibitor LprI family protein n=1 Tax=Mesorhizobium sp. M2E.F.Ca.ET.209.01.1.1 TaxID=2500526 RepID=UPI000FD9E99C|nr:lysozyme inhibitor LprI family protein [Mesorhizobium sp. M2E.F.Ca.ET.209.01.1.1]TGS09243.1 hypothetical protein EN852_031815 [Mesorhizobium sp. M2E.F.Ca.ET.209.01.1.1]